MRLNLRNEELHFDSVSVTDESVFWCQSDFIHNTPGAAAVYTDGSQFWYFNNERHREDGPSIIYASGYNAWYKNGKLHREDGPAVIYANGKTEYWVDNAPLSEEEFVLYRISSSRRSELHSKSILAQ